MKNLSHLFIERPIMTTLVMTAFVIFGIFGYVSLPVSELPNIDFPTINVNANLPGADPETMASAVATPLENAFSTIPGIDTMTSTSGQGNTNITLQFKLSRNIDAAAQDVQTAISGSLRKLPKTMPVPPTFNKQDPSAFPIFFIALRSDTLPISKVDLYARSVLANQISTLDGVGNVMIRGAAKYAVRIQADPAALAARGLGLNDLINAANLTNSNIASGTLNGDSKTAIIHSDAQLTNAEEFRNQIIAYRNGAPVRYGDVANVADSVENIRSADFLDGERAVTLGINRQPGSNTMEVVANIRHELEIMKNQIPPSIKVEVFYDRSQTISAAIDDVQVTLLIAGALVVGVIFLFLRNASATLIPSLALPIAVIGTFAGMWALDYNIDNLSLMALTLSVGFVVDDAIVMLENIVRHIEAGKTPHEAAMIGSAEIGFTIFSMTVSLAAVFIPVAFMGDIIGRLLHEFAITIMLAIGISGIVSITLTPMLCDRLLKPGSHGDTHSKFYQYSEAAFSWLHNGYDSTLRWSLAHRRTILCVFFASILCTIGLFKIMPQDFLPSDDTGQLRVNVQVATGTAFDQKLVYAHQVLDIVQKDPNVAQVESDESGNVTVVTKPLGERKLTADQVANQLRRKLQGIPGTAITVQNPPAIRVGGRQGRGNYQYTLQGLDLAELQATAAQLEQVMQADTRTFVGVNTDQDRASPSVQVDIDRAKAAAMGITPTAIQTAMGAAFGGQQVSQIYAAVDQYQVMLELLPEYQKDPSALQRVYLTGTGGVMVPLSAVTTMSRSTMPQTINHAGQIPAVTVSFDMAPGKALSDAVEGVTKATQSINMPASITGSFAGTAAAFQKSTANMSVLLFVALLVVYIILGVLYESFIHPLTILSGLPSAAMGALITLWIVQLPLTIYAFVGMIMLIGIVKKNAIMMVDFALERSRDDVTVTAEEAIFEAAMVRFRPIMMTTMAALMGTLPIAFGHGMGADARRPLGLCVAGGLVLSQLLTLYITPVIYIYLDRYRARIDFKPMEDQQPVPVPAE